ncbi:hypothetical protein SLEP1_g40037 [Rubroshorea leprosula]|uniref:Uncharacterized protein n=1 Tax=Rubroshorea leprosula TaxID=152421 RepID=A0AAV5L2D3_9ROSI|nr:hypothetical protein SLEP1_g40037 [Rubroshorea leprosula]
MWLGFRQCQSFKGSHEGPSRHPSPFLPRSMATMVMMTLLLLCHLLPWRSKSKEVLEEKALVYGLRENPKKSFRFANPGFSFTPDFGYVVLGRENEIELRNPTCKRSRRNKNQLPRRVETRIWKGKRSRKRWRRRRNVGEE